MTFAAATTMQMLVAGAAIAGLVVWLFFLKLRHPRILVPSLQLWHSLLREERPESWWDRVRRAVSLALALAIALLIVTALGSPRTLTQASGEERPVTLVIDTSPTMLTRTSDGRTRWDHARERARAIIQGGEAAGVELIDTGGATVVPAAADTEQKLAVLDRMRPGVASRPALDAIARSQGNNRVYLVSDGVATSSWLPPSGGSQARLTASAEATAVEKPGTTSFLVASGFSRNNIIPISVFERAANVGITAFDLREVPSLPGTYEAYLELVNYSQRPRHLSLTVGSPIRSSPARTIDVAPLEAYRETIDASQLEPGIVRAEIRTEGDALDVDNVAYSYLPARLPVRVLLVTPGSEYLQTSLALDPRVRLTTIAPKQYRDDLQADLFVFDRFVPPAAPRGPVLLLGLPAVQWITGADLDLARPVIENPPVTTVSADHVLMQAVALRDVAIKRAVGLTITKGEQAEALAWSGDRPLIIAGRAGRSPRKWVLVGFPLEASDFGTHVGFPIFLQNVTRWIQTDQAPIHRGPGRISVPGRATITTADGRRPASTDAGGTTSFDAVPGVYFAQSSGERTPIVVNLTTRAISDVNHSAFPPASASDEPPRIAGRNLGPVLLMMALLLVSVEWWTYHRRLTV